MQSAAVLIVSGLLLVAACVFIWRFAARASFHLNLASRACLAFSLACGTGLVLISAVSLLA